MSYVAINVLTVPEGAGPTLEERFAARQGAVDSAEGFEHFELLRPVAGTGDYLVYVSSVGLRAARRRVQREQGERELVANFTLSIDLELLAATKITAAKPARATNSINPYQPETGASEKWSDGINGQISPTIAGGILAK